MAPTDGPPLLLRVLPQGIVPAKDLDADTLTGIRFGSILTAKVRERAPSKALRAYWALLGAIVKADDSYVSPRALSNSILIEFGLIESEALLGGGVRNDPMSLKSFTEDQLWLLVEKVKLLTVVRLIPGVDVEALMDNARAR